MFPERRLLHEDLNAFNRIAVKETCVIIITKVVWFGQTIVTHFAQCPLLTAYLLGYLIQPFE